MALHASFQLCTLQHFARSTKSLHLQHTSYNKIDVCYP